MGEEAAVERYEPGPTFEEVKEEAMLDMSPTDSKEFWLIQWIKDKDLDVSGFHGKELSLKLHKDGNLGRLESSSGKSYDLVSFSYQQPNATVFLPSGSEPKAVGKISRRVCLIRHREPEKLNKRNCGSLTPSSKKFAERKGSDSSASVLGGSDRQHAMVLQSAGSPRKNPNKKQRLKMRQARFVASGIAKKCSSQCSALSVGAMSEGQTPEHNEKRKDESNVGRSDVSGKTSEVPDTRGAQGNTATETPQITPEEPPNKKVKIGEL